MSITDNVAFVVHYCLVLPYDITDNVFDVHYQSRIFYNT